MDVCRTLLHYTKLKILLRGNDTVNTDYTGCFSIAIFLDTFGATTATQVAFQLSVIVDTTLHISTRSSRGLCFLVTIIYYITNCGSYK